MATRKAKPAVSTDGTPPDAFTSELSQPVSVATNTAADLSKSLTRGRRKFVGDIAKAVTAGIVAAEKPAVILDPNAFSAELKKHKTEELDERDRVVGWRLSDEGVRLIRERQTAIESNWRPDDISEADQYPEPLKTVVAFRLLCGQYVAVAGISMDSLKDHWKRSKLCDLFSPMADDVAAAMVATNEDPKGLFRSLAFCNETDQMRFVDAWRCEILPALKVVEIKLKNQLGNATATNGNEHTEADGVPAVGTGGTKNPDAVAAPAVVVKADNRKATGKAGGRPRKVRRTSEESKVMNYRKANSKAGFCDIDDELELERGESQRIYEAVTRRERRKKSESADKTGRN